jgi:hypothetical protein
MGLSMSSIHLRGRWVFDLAVGRGRLLWMGIPRAWSFSQSSIGAEVWESLQ